MLLVSACDEDISIEQPTYLRISQDSVRIQVKLDAEEAAFIRDKEIYLTLTALECASGSDRYPAEAMVGNEKVSMFDFPITGENVTFHGDMPTEVFDRYEKPCVLLEGGGYQGRTISSKPTPLEPEAR